MLVTAASSVHSIALIVHIVAVIAIFVVTLGWPLVVRTVGGLRNRPPVYVHKMRVLLSRAVVNPALLVALIAGVYLATDEHAWQSFWVLWGLGAILVIGGLEGGIIARTHRRQAQLAAEEHEQEGEEGDQALKKYGRRARVNDIAEWLVVLIVVLSAVFMSAKP
ncbi:MAG: DUF2269 family protein [Solirubrobacterales bacterium]|nr:DUF2269 family protein [Solirubrobacterales bacterium]